MPRWLHSQIERWLANAILDVAALHAGEEFGWWELREWGEA